MFPAPIPFPMTITTLSAHDAMQDSLMAIAEAGADIVPLYFDRFFARFPGQASNFHNRATSQGAMVNEMLTMLLAQASGESWVPMMMRAQVATHHDHGAISLDEYRGALDLLVEVLADAAGDRWSAAAEAAWCGEADRLYALIERAY